MRRLLKPLFILSTLLCLLPALPGAASTQTAEEIILKIEDQRFRWLGVKSDVTLNFTTAQNKTASCSGRLTYYRLEEKMLLECFNTSGQLLFMFSTDDMDFQLYLASENAVYQGNIFDLEDSDRFSSHIKPFDLYRSLKSMPILPGHASIAAENARALQLNVWSSFQGKPYLKRALNVSEEGHVPFEVYFKKEGGEELKITREAFLELGKIPGSKKEIAYFPSRVTLENVPEQSRTEILFSEPKALWNNSGAGWVLKYPESTRFWEIPKPDPDNGYQPPRLIS